jgi:hypothetical protein
MLDVTHSDERLASDLWKGFKAKTALGEELDLS